MKLSFFVTICLVLCSCSPLDVARDDSALFAQLSIEGDQSRLIIENQHRSQSFCFSQADLPNTVLRTGFLVFSEDGQERHFSNAMPMELLPKVTLKPGERLTLNGPSDLWFGPFGGASECIVFEAPFEPCGHPIGAPDVASHLLRGVWLRTSNGARPAGHVGICEGLPGIVRAPPG